MSQDLVAGIHNIHSPENAITPNVVQQLLQKNLIKNPCLQILRFCRVNDGEVQLTLSDGLNSILGILIPLLNPVPIQGLSIIEVLDYMVCTVPDPKYGEIVFLVIHSYSIIQQGSHVKLIGSPGTSVYPSPNDLFWSLPMNITSVSYETPKLPYLPNYSIARIVNETYLPNVYLQIVGIREDPNPYSSSTFTIALSDGVMCSKFHVFSPMLSRLFREDIVTNFCVIRLKHYSSHIIDNEELLVVEQFSLLLSGSVVGHRIGNPRLLSVRSASTFENPLALGDSQIIRHQLIPLMPSCGHNSDNAITDWLRSPCVATPNASGTSSCNSYRGFQAVSAEYTQNTALYSSQMNGFPITPYGTNTYSQSHIRTQYNDQYNVSRIEAYEVQQIIIGVPGCSSTSSNRLDGQQYPRLNLINGIMREMTSRPVPPPQSSFIFTDNALANHSAITTCYLNTNTNMSYQNLCNESIYANNTLSNTVSHHGYISSQSQSKALSSVQPSSYFTPNFTLDSLNSIFHH